MKGDTELQEEDDWVEEDIDSPKRGGAGSSNRNRLSVLVGILIAAFLAATISYFVSKRSGSDTKLLQMKLAAFEEKISSLERQISDLQGKSGTAGTDPALLQRLEDLARKVEALEKRAQTPVAIEARSAPHKPAGEAEKRYHTVQKGETLFKISRIYGIAPERLRKLNNLSAGQLLRTGQKLLVSSGG